LSTDLSGPQTILKHGKDSVNDPHALALGALGWLLRDDTRARRFLDLTGLTPDSLRAALAEPATHQAVLDFLCAHEPDLIGASDALGVAPAELAAARDRL
jgi:hypothetical protein